MSLPSQATSDHRPRVLLIEDSPSTAQVYLGYLAREPLEVTHVETGSAALATLERESPHVVLLDLHLPDMDGMEILNHMTRRRLPTSVVVITSNDSVSRAVDAMRLGAYDYLVKTEFDASRLTLTLRNALEKQRLSRIVDTLRDEAREGYCGFIGSSLPMQAVYRIIESAAPSRATVFITGESGTGKEICAEAIHTLSPRSSAPFIALNCGAIPRDLMESEIFGHIKGAFTGATSERKGAAALADGGTLFLDEICEMDLDLQTKLLRFVQTGGFQAVGSSKEEKVDVRFICATNRDPLAEVEAGRFREDLYYRLHVIPVQLPPLRERENDVLAIAQHFLARYAEEEGRGFTGFSPRAQEILLDYDWPGNVRQLQNVVHSVIVLNEGQEVDAGMLPAPLGKGGASGTPRPRSAAAEPPATAGIESRPASAVRPLQEVEREAIEAAIGVCDGNIPKAAALLDISASTIYRKRQAWSEHRG